MTDIEHMLASFTNEQNKAALQVLDALTRPLTVRDIEGQLRRHGVPKSRAVITAASLKGLAIIAILDRNNEWDGAEVAIAPSLSLRNWEVAQ